MTSTSDARALALGYFSAHPQRHNIGFGTDHSRPRPSALGQPVLHALNDGPLIVCGRTGSGKTTALVQLALDAPESTLIIVDIKSEISAVAAAHRERFGPVHVVDPWRIGTRTPARINPLDLIGDPSTSLSAGDDAAVIADALVVDWGGHDRYWDAAAKSAIQMGALLLAGHAPASARNLGTLGDMLSAGVGPTLSGFLAAGLCSDIGDGMVRREAGNLTGLASPTLSSITAHLAASLRPLGSPLVRASLSGSDIDLASITRGEPQTIFLTVPADKVRSHAGLQRVWLNVLIAAIARRRSKPATPTIILVDEVGQLGALDALLTAAFLLRGYGVSLGLFLQSGEQLQRLYPGDARALLDNAGSIVSLTGGGSMRRLIEIAAGPHAALNAEEPGAGEAVLIRDGKAALFRKADYRQDSRYAHLAGLNPLHLEAAHEH